MTARKSFLIILRIFFLLFSLKFLKDAFYKWDGFSYYMSFIEFLPDLSLAFILWTVVGVIIAIVLWLIIYSLSKVIPKSLIPLRLEYIMAFFIFIMLPLYIKRNFYRGISLSNLIGLNHSLLLVIGGILVVFVFWFCRKHIENILYKINARLTPLVWLFAVLFIFAVPLSILTRSAPETKYIASNKAYGASQETAVTHTDQPNIILVIMDALTARDMQVYGYGYPTTPFISKWSKDAIVFTKAYSPSNWTSSSVMSMLTGQRVWIHKVWHHAYRSQYVSPFEENLPRILRDYGYDVYCFVQNEAAHPDELGLQDAFLLRDTSDTFWVPERWWFEKLASFFNNRPIIRDWIFTHNFFANRIMFYRPPKYATAYPPELVYNAFLDYIPQTQSSKSRRPFFAWLHVMPPHNPILPPKPYMGMFGDAEKYNTDEKQAQNFNFHKDYNTEMQKDIDILRKRYDEFILYSDKQFEQFLSRLADTIDLSKTIIILSSDHGESFSHGFLGHGRKYLYESVIHIPLIIKIPVGLESHLEKINDKAIDIPIEQIDIAPTILELAGIPIPTWMEGRSLLPLLEGKTIEPKPVFSMQFKRNRGFGHPITKGSISVRKGDYKLIYYLEDKKTQLFNVESDSDETQNILQDKPKIAQRLMELINDNLSHANKRITQSREK